MEFMSLNYSFQKIIDSSFIYGISHDFDLTIVIPSHASNRTLRQCLQSIQQQKTTYRFKVIVIHSGVEQIDQTLIKDYNEVYFHVIEDRWLPSQARNWGLMQCKTEWLMYIDSDCLLDAGYIENMMHKVSQGGIDGIGGCVRNANPHHLPGFVMHQLEFGEWAESNVFIETHNFPTCNSVYRCSVLIEMGGFPDVYPCEDTIMNYRLCQAGYKLFFFGKFGIQHIHQKSWSSVAKYNYLHGVAYGYTTIRYHLDGYKLHDLPALLALVMIIVGRYFRITKRTAKNKSGLILWIFCTPFALICLTTWAIGYVNHHKHIDNKEKINIEDMEWLKL